MAFAKGWGYFTALCKESKLDASFGSSERMGGLPTIPFLGRGKLSRQCGNGGLQRRIPHHEWLKKQP
eukprot:3133253-Amphidinium_carterae.3